MAREENEKNANAKERALIDGAIKKMRKLTASVTNGVKKGDMVAVVMIGKNQSETEGILYMTDAAIPLVEKYIRSDEFQVAVSDAAREKRGEQCDCPKCQISQVVDDLTKVIREADDKGEDGKAFNKRLVKAIDKMVAMRNIPES